MSDVADAVISGAAYMRTITTLATKAKYSSAAQISSPGASVIARPRSVRASAKSSAERCE